MGDSSEALPLLKPSASSLMDKSSEVRKAAESFMNEILRICGQEMVGRNLKELPSPTLAIVSERLKLSTVHEGGVVHIWADWLAGRFSESVKVVSTSMSLPSKAGLKNNKHGPNDRGSNVGKPVSQDKSSEVRKAAESFMNEILRICGQEMVGRNLKELPSPTLAIVSERLKLSTVHEGGVVHIWAD
ncbi:Protein MOR1, partial [Zea mays]